MGYLFFIFFKCLTIKDLFICVLENVYLSVLPDYALALQRLDKAYAVQRRMIEAGTIFPRDAYLFQPHVALVPI